MAKSPVPAAMPADCTDHAGGCLTEFFRLLGKAHVLPLLHLFLQEPRPRRFVELQEALGMSPNTLAERLKELTEAGLLTRTAYNEIPPRVDYQATAKARELNAVFGALCAWAEKFDLAPEARPMLAVAVPPAA